MQAIILAAGMGKRLGELTQNNTKCMVKVNGITLIDRLMTQLSELSLKKIIIVIGYQGEKLRSYLGDNYLNTKIEYIYNPIYDKTNNIYSLALAKESLQEDDSLLIESDLIFDNSLFRKIIDNPYPDIALVDKYESWMDGTMVTLDEENNIEWSRRLEDAGCRIIYGIDHIKVHSKLCQITYKKDGEIRHITQIGTGNYNEKTAKLYTDLSVMTANEKIGEESAEVFHALCLEQLVEKTKYLLVAPKCLQSKIIVMIDEEIAKAKAGKPAYVGAKMNALTDKVIIDKLVEASKAGVKIELIIR